MYRTEPVTAMELRRLLFEIKALEPKIGFRFRLMGELWQTKYYRIALLTDRGVALSNEDRKLMVIANLNLVMQFELVEPFGHFQPNFHYAVESANS